MTVQEKIVINTFGHTHSEVKEFEIVRLWAHNANTSLPQFSASMEAICVPEICKPLVNQNAKYYRDSYSHLKHLTLTDFSRGSEEFSVHVLIGLDYYYSFITGEVLRGNEGPIAVKSKLGWILSGGVAKQNQSNCFEIHTMKCVNESEIDNLQRDLKNYGRLKPSQVPTRTLWTDSNKTSLLTEKDT